MIITPNSYFKFSGGEVHCKFIEESSRMHIIMRDYTMDGFMALAQQVEILRRLGQETIQVSYPYLPYARQDRVMAPLEPFSLKVFCQLLNSLELDKVWLYDPHSDVAPALINNCVVGPQWTIAKQAIPEEWFAEGTVWVSPDAGAYKKVSKLVPDDKQICIGTKIRSPEGRIVSTEVYSPVDLTNRRCIIVDDICDGGRTFIELAKALKERGAIYVALYITHGIFSNGFEELQKYIDHIYTTDTIPAKGDPRGNYVTTTQVVI